MIYKYNDSEITKAIEGLQKYPEILTFTTSSIRNSSLVALEVPVTGFNELIRKMRGRM